MASRMQEPGSPSGSGLSPSARRKRRPRTVYSEQQLGVLEEFFKGKPYGSYEEREALAAKLDLQEYQVQVWLKNRRAKERRLQRQPQGQKSPGAHAAPQEPTVCAPQPALAPAAPAFHEGPVLPASPVLPPHCPWQVFPAADASASSYSQACWHPAAQGVQDVVPAAPAPAAAPSPHAAIAQATVWPQVPDEDEDEEDATQAAWNISPDPDFTDLLSALEDLEEPFSSPRPWYDFVGDGDVDLFQLLGLQGTASPPSPADAAAP